MDDPTKDTIPRSAVEYCLRKETVNTNPDEYEAHERFIAYMDDPDIAQFGHWMHSNGFNCALTAIAVDLDKIPSVTPKEQRWIPVTLETLPNPSSVVVVCGKKGTWDYGTYRGWHGDIHSWWWKKNTIKHVYWWMYKDDALPEPYREEGGAE